ncbi:MULTISPECIES: hypothetical protein [Bacteroidota]|uniref:Uncharacterized protein n=1 Tax=Chryseobacterium bernardetii TaxID=1241978 RepID=A0A3G6TEJ1_9FLAO|nr:MULTISPECIES: hypothetical protein [Bacteroidota]AZB25106.1 hypothetical protein EG339_11215 [Chryseobacterium bernardetii]QRQ63194.1 hypothetical protein I6J33_09600 [Sphingobacterium multivorum]
MEKELPIYTDPDYGIEFIVDIQKFEFRERANPDNRYTLEDISDLGEEGYFFDHFDKSTGMTICIKPPQFVTLAPQQMAEKYNKAVEEILLLTDFELMVDQEVLTRRIKYGELPTIKIGDHIFYADARIDLLRPKDDFSSVGIRFDDLEDWYVEDKNVYAFPYDPKNYKIGDREWDKILDYPTDLIFVEIPHVRTLDPVGWNRRHGWREIEDLKETGLKLDFKAELVPWNKSGIDKLIWENRIKQPIREAVKERDKRKENKKGRKL